VHFVADLFAIIVAMPGHVQDPDSLTGSLAFALKQVGRSRWNQFLSRNPTACDGAAVAIAGDLVRHLALANWNVTQGVVPPLRTTDQFPQGHVATNISIPEVPGDRPLKRGQ
jgi:hypothetical protein